MIIGLTGGIGTGKTTVAQEFAKLGAHVILSDALVHKALHSTGAAYDLVRYIFSDLDGLLDESGEINRKVLGKHVFSNPSAMQQLTEVVHPIVDGMFHKAIKDFSEDDVVIYEVAMLFEYEIDQDLEEMMYVVSTWCPADVQLQRVMGRDKLSEDDALQRINAQMSADQKREWADFAIDTSRADWETRTSLVFDTIKKLIPLRRQVERLAAECPKEY